MHNAKTFTGTISEIVKADYRTAYVFEKNGIDYCCGAKRTLHQACEMMGVNTNDVEDELHKVVRDIRIPGMIDFRTWPLDFLVDYIQRLHHAYLKQALPHIIERLEHFVPGHKNKYPYITQVQSLINDLYRCILIQIDIEEKTIFPYIRQVNNAFKNGADYGSLLVRTLRKSLDQVLVNKRGEVPKLLIDLRLCCNNYMAAQNTCTTHKVIMQKIQEIDNDIIQYLFLENSILWPEVARIENELLHL